MSAESPTLPPGVTVLQRGWLSANNVVCQGGAGGAALVDSGYCTHAEQTLALVESALDGEPLARLVNTHLHSDHCGGNAALQARWPQLTTLIPPGQLDLVRSWNAQELTYEPTGQLCPPFRADGVLAPGSEIELAGRPWQIQAAPGHDPHAVLLFEPESAVLISGDALWENGFGIVFPELDGESGFAETADTLELIASLAPRIVIPGHGSVFGDVPAALERARKRLEGFRTQPLKHARYAAKVMLKYKLLEWQQIREDEALSWLLATPHFCELHQRFFADQDVHQWHAALVRELAEGGALRREDGLLINV